MGLVFSGMLIRWIRLMFSLSPSGAALRKVKGELCQLMAEAKGQRWTDLSKHPNITWCVALWDCSNYSNCSLDQNGAFTHRRKLEIFLFHSPPKGHSHLQMSSFIWCHPSNSVNKVVFPYAWGRIQKFLLLPFRKEKALHTKTTAVTFC